MTSSRWPLLAALAAALVVGVCVVTPSVNAQLENQIFSSPPHRLRVVVPRGWRATDQPSYPGLLLWMLRSQPEGKIVLTAEPFTRAVYCSWPLECRTSPDPLPAKAACALRNKLVAQRMRVGPTQSGPKENTQAGLPSVWFELDDTKRFLRQAVAIGEDQVISMVLSAPSAEARGTHVRAFEQALRTLRPLTLEELGIPRVTPPISITPMALQAAGGGDDAGVAVASAGDAGVLADAGVTAATTFESAPVTKIEPVGPCAKQ